MLYCCCYYTSWWNKDYYSLRKAFMQHGTLYLTFAYWFLATPHTCMTDCHCPHHRQFRRCVQTDRRNCRVSRDDDRRNCWTTGGRCLAVRVTGQTTTDSACRRTARRFVSSENPIFIRRVGLSMINLPTKFEISTFTNYAKIWKTTQNVDIAVVWELGVTEGNWQCYRSIERIRLPIRL